MRIKASKGCNSGRIRVAHVSGECSELRIGPLFAVWKDVRNQTKHLGCLCLTSSLLTHLSPLTLLYTRMHTPALASYWIPRTALPPPLPVPRPLFFLLSIVFITLQYSIQIMYLSHALLIVCLGEYKLHEGRNPFLFYLSLYSKHLEQCLVYVHINSACWYLLKRYIEWVSKNGTYSASSSVLLRTQEYDHNKLNTQNN